jgi:hypothetical protein
MLSFLTPKPLSETDRLETDCLEMDGFEVARNLLIRRSLFRRPNTAHRLLYRLPGLNL